MIHHCGFDLYFMKIGAYLCIFLVFSRQFYIFYTKISVENILTSQNTHFWKVYQTPYSPIVEDE